MNNIFHRWAHHDLGRRGELHSGNLHAYPDYFNSYGTTIAKFLADDVVVICDLNLSPSTGRHISNVCQTIPVGVHIIYTRRHNQWYYDDVNFYAGSGWGEAMVKHLLERITTEMGKFKTEKKIDTWSRHAMRWIGDIKYLYEHKHFTKKRFKEEYKKYFKLLEFLFEEHNVGEMCDFINGPGCYIEYLVRVAPILKAQKTRETRAAEREKERKEAIAKYDTLGIDYIRERWISGKDLSIHTTARHSLQEICYGGNVLLRFNSKSEIVTSKGIKISQEQARRFWAMIQRWKSNPEAYEKSKFDTLSGTYSSHSFKDGILTAGCHQIAYSEMERIMKELESKIV